MTGFSLPWDYETPEARAERERNKFRNDAMRILDTARQREEQAAEQRRQEFRSAVQPTLSAYASLTQMAEERSRKFREAVQPTIDNAMGRPLNLIGSEAGRNEPASTEQGAPIRDERGLITSFQGYEPKNPFTEAAKFATRSVLPESALSAVESVPVAGPSLRTGLGFATSPLGAALTAVAPAGMAAGLAGQTALGTGGGALEELGVPDIPTPLGDISLRTAGEVVGGVATPSMLTAPGRAARRAFSRGLEEQGGVSGLARRLVTEEIGGTRLSRSPEEGALAKLDKILSRQPKDWDETLKLRHEELSQRVAEAQSIRDKAIAEGRSPLEAVEQSKSALRGKMPVTQAAGFDFSPEEEAWLWDKILGLDYFKQANLGTMLKEMAENPTRVMRPFEKRYLDEAVGRQVAEKMEQASIVRSRAFKGELPDMSKPPKGVSKKIEAPESLWGPQELPLIHKLSPGPAGELSYDPQRALDLRLKLASEPKGVSKGVGEASDIGAKSPTLPDINAPTGDLSTVLPKKEPYLIDIIADSLGLPRAVMSSADLSFLRQTSKTIGRHPMLTKEALTKAAQAAKSEESAVRWMKELESDPFLVSVRTPDGAVRDVAMGQLAKEKLHMAVPGTPGYSESGIMAKPEFFVSRWGQKIPIVRQSGRAYAVGVNTTMQGVARYWFGKFMKMNGGAISPKQLDAVLNLTKRLNGQGELGGSWFAKTLKALGFAPGYRISGPEAFANLLRNPLNRESRQIQRMAAEELFTWASAGSAMLTAVKIAVPGAIVYTAIGSPNFGRIQFPGSKTVYNIWGTDQILARTVLEVVGKKKINRLGEEQQLGSGEKGVRGYLSAAVEAGKEYLQSGEDPIVGLITEVASGETYLGEDLGWDMASFKKMILDRMPMAAQDIKDVAQTDGPVQAIVSAPFAFFGGGISSYETAREKLAGAYDQRVASGQFGPAAKPFTEEATIVRSSRVANDPELNKLNLERDTESQKINFNTEQALIPTAKAVGDNLPDAGMAYREQRKDVLQERMNRKDQLFADKPQQAREADKLADQYYAIEPKDTNGNGFIDSQDMEAFFTERDAFLAKVPADLKQAITDPAWHFQDAKVVEAERRYQTAKEDSRVYYDQIPKYKGLTVEEGETVDAARSAMEILREQGGDPEQYDNSWAFNKIKKLIPPKIAVFIDENFLPSPYKGGGLRGNMGGGRLGGGFGRGYRGEEETPLNPQRDEYALAHPDLIYFGLVSLSTLSMQQKAQLAPEYRTRQLTPEMRQLVGSQ